MYEKFLANMRQRQLTKERFMMMDAPTKQNKTLCCAVQQNPLDTRSLNHDYNKT